MSPPLRPRFKPQPGFRCASEVRREPLTMRELVWPVVFLWCGVCTCVAADWERPGCHKVGHTRRINIPECVEFSMTTNACRGFCESWSIPSSLETALVNPHQPITSIGQCCNIMDTEDVEVTVMCLDGPRDLVFKSATSCSCFHCKKD